MMVLRLNQAGQDRRNKQNIVGSKEGLEEKAWKDISPTLKGI